MSFQIIWCKYVLRKNINRLCVRAYIHGFYCTCQMYSNICFTSQPVILFITYLRSRSHSAYSIRFEIAKIIVSPCYIGVRSKIIRANDLFLSNNFAIFSNFSFLYRKSNKICSLRSKDRAIADKNTIRRKWKVMTLLLSLRACEIRNRENNCCLILLRETAFRKRETCRGGRISCPKNFKFEKRSSIFHFSSKSKRNATLTRIRTGVKTRKVNMNSPRFDRKALNRKASTRVEVRGGMHRAFKCVETWLLTAGPCYSYFSRIIDYTAELYSIRLIFLSLCFTEDFAGKSPPDVSSHCKYNELE